VVVAVVVAQTPVLGGLAVGLDAAEAAQLGQVYLDKEMQAGKATQMHGSVVPVAVLERLD
jgi:hypothetical protein